MNRITGSSGGGGVAQYLSNVDRSLRTAQYVQGFGERVNTVTMSTPLSI